MKIRNLMISVIINRIWLAVEGGSLSKDHKISTTGSTEIKRVKARRLFLKTNGIISAIGKAANNTLNVCVPIRYAYAATISDAPNDFTNALIGILYVSD